MQWQIWRAAKNERRTYPAMIGKKQVTMPPARIMTSLIGHSGVFTLLNTPQMKSWPSLSLFIILLFSTGCTSIPQGPWASRGLPNFSKVDSHLYRGAQPAPQGIQELRQLGIATIVNLRRPKEAPETQRAEQHAAQAAGLRYYSVPMTGSRAPTRDEILHVLSLIDDAQNQPVFIHCHRGADRTGAVVAIYRISHQGWTADQSIQEAMDHGMAWREFCLRRAVRDWEKQQPRE